MNSISIKTPIISIIEKNMSLQGITGAEMARRLKTSPSQIYKVLRDESHVNTQTLDDMLCVLGLTLKIDVASERVSEDMQNAS